MSGIRAHPLVLAVGVAGIAATGAWFGAGLKGDQQVRKKQKEVKAKETSDAYGMAPDLEATIARLKGQQAHLERKIDDFKKQMEARKSSG